MHRRHATPLRIYYFAWYPCPFTHFYYQLGILPVLLIGTTACQLQSKTSLDKTFAEFEKKIFRNRRVDIEDCSVLIAILGPRNSERQGGTNTKLYIIYCHVILREFGKRPSGMAIENAVKVEEIYRDYLVQILAKAPNLAKMLFMPSLFHAIPCWAPRQAKPGPPYWQNQKWPPPRLEAYHCQRTKSVRIIKNNTFVRFWGSINLIFRVK